MMLLSKIADALDENEKIRLNDFDFIYRQTHRIEKIIDSMRLMAKPKRLMEKIAVNDLLEEVLSDMEDGLHKRQITLAKELKPTPHINADHMELYSIFSNLIRNAMQAIEKKDTKAESFIKISTVQYPTDFVQILVEDSGIGIPLEQQDQIFEFGFTDKGREGTGMGLSLSRKIARSYKGDIKILKSTPEKGTIVQVTLLISTQS